MKHTDVTLSFEDVDVWQKAVDFAEEVVSVIDEFSSDRRYFRLIEQLESSATSIAMNIAEGKGRFSKKEFAQFLYIARGSLFETSTLIEIFKRRNWINETQYNNFR
jgi:four helix bundle protein